MYHTLFTEMDVFHCDPVLIMLKARNECSRDVFVELNAQKRNRKFLALGDKITKWSRNTCTETAGRVAVKWRRWAGEDARLNLIMATERCASRSNSTIRLMRPVGSSVQVMTLRLAGSCCGSSLANSDLNWKTGKTTEQYDLNQIPYIGVKNWELDR